MPDRELVSGSLQDEDLQFEAGLRPRRLADFTGQSKLKENLSIAIEAARMRSEAMDHVLLYGPPGLGKTTLASIIAEELGQQFTPTSTLLAQDWTDDQRVEPEAAMDWTSDPAAISVAQAQAQASGRALRFQDVVREHVTHRPCSFPLVRCKQIVEFQHPGKESHERPAC